MRAGVTELRCARLVQVTKLHRGLAGYARPNQGKRKRLGQDPSVPHESRGVSTQAQTKVTLGSVLKSNQPSEIQTQLLVYVVERRRHPEGMPVMGSVTMPIEDRKSVV